MSNISRTSTQRLLARFEIQHVAADPLAAIGDTGTLAIVQAPVGFVEELILKFEPRIRAVQRVLTDKPA